jgi:hypothetical protein
MKSAKLRNACPGPSIAGLRTVSKLGVSVSALLFFSISTLAAQAPVTSLGLGYPVVPLDARAAAMGGTGLGLMGGTLSGRNPADLRGFSRPSLGITYAPEAVDVKSPGTSQTTGRSRLAIVQAVVPLRSWTVGMSFASGLDQDWSVSLQDTLESSYGDFPYDERREHDGGVSMVTLGVARQIDRFSVGIDGTLLTGSLRQTFFRRFDVAVDDPGRAVEVASGEARFSWSGLRLRGGLATAIGSRVRVSGQIGISTDLKATRDTIGDAETYEFAMPLEWSVGGSARLAENLLASAAVGFADWSATAADLEGGAASDVLWYGAGLEYVGLEVFGAMMPLRAGFRRTDLPFHNPAEEPLSETAGTFGIGMEIGGGRAAFDVALEFGTRGDLEASGLEEGFRRFSLSMALLQF